MVGKRCVVVPGAFLIQFIGQGFTAPVGKRLRGDHSLDWAAMYFWMVSLFLFIERLFWRLVARECNK